MDLLGISRSAGVQDPVRLAYRAGARATWSYDATDETWRDQARKAVRDEKAESLRAYLRRLRDGPAYIELRLDDTGLTSNDDAEHRAS